MLVSRTASEEPDTPLGEELARQIFGIPKALEVAALFVAGLGPRARAPGRAVPRARGGIALRGARALRSARARGDAGQRPVGAKSRRARRGADRSSCRWSCRGDRGERGIFAPLLDDAPDRDEGARERIRARAIALRESIFAELGVPLPPPRVRVNASLPASHALVVLFEVPARVAAIPAGTPSPAALVEGHARDVLRARAADFLGLAETQRLLDELEQIAPAVVRNVVPKPLPLTTLADVLRRLVDEGDGIRDLRAILEALATIAATERNR